MTVASSVLFCIHLFADGDAILLDFAYSLFQNATGTELIRVCGH